MGCSIMAEVGLLYGCAVTQPGPCTVQCWTHQRVWGCGQDSLLNTRQLVYHLDHVSSAQCAATELHQSQRQAEQVMGHM